MSMLTVADDLFERLSRRAAALDVTVEELIAPVLNLAAMPSEFPPENGGALLDAWLENVQTRAKRYPTGFVMDDSRESIYERCGE